MADLSQQARHVGATLLGGLAVCAATAQTAQPSAVEMVDALNGVFGKHAQARASHAKGACVVGHFKPDAQARSVTRGAMWTQVQIPVEARFSVGGGNPKASDKGKTVRGLSLHIGKELDLVALSAPVFMVATPEEFIGFMGARRADPATGKPDPARVKAFNDATPSTKPQIEFLEKTAVPASYAQTPYWAVNAFVFTNAQGQQVHGRWRLEPDAGRLGLTPEQLSQLGDDFLLPELQSRLQTQSVSFSVWLQLAKPGDDVKNPTVLWPTDNPQVRMGQIVITGLGGGCEPTMFNPAVLPQGITMSEDPTLLVRAGAYAVSLGRRLSP